MSASGHSRSLNPLVDQTEQVGLDPKTTANFAAAKIVSRVETLAGRVFLERTCAGHELRTMRLLGRRRHPLIEIRSRDDATLVRSGASTTELQGDRRTTVLAASRAFKPLTYV
jgi:hypothetical protein